MSTSVEALAATSHLEGWMPTDFSISISYHPGSVTLACGGELDIATVRKLADAIDMSLDPRPQSMTLDLESVTLLTTSGIETLLDAASRCREEGIELTLCMSQHCRRILDLLGLWWLGVVPNGSEIEDAFAHVVRRYSELRLQGQIHRQEAV